MKRRITAMLLAIAFVCALLPATLLTASAHAVVMTADEFIGYLQYVVDRGDSRYGSGDQFSVGKYDGTNIYFDCWGLGESIICTKGRIVYNRDPSLNPWNLWDTSCGCGSYSGDWLESQCQLSGDFTNMVPGEWLFKENSNGYCYHVGYYIGNGKVIESTSDGTYNTQVTTIDSSGHSNIRGSSWTWTFHGKVPWIEYTGSTPPSPSDDSLSLYSYNYPTSLNVGEAFSIYGTVSSGYSNISSLTVGVYNTSGGMETGKTVHPNSRTYSIANIDPYVVFNSLSAGTYYYRITATNASGTKQLLNQQFSVVGTPTVDVVRTVDCYRKVQLPARVIDLYWNPTDTSRASYFDYGPYLGCPTYAEMTDGSIMYKANVNHQGVDTQMWFKLESDMSVTVKHTYGSVQYEYAHPHAAYETCACGYVHYTGANGSRDDCTECHPVTFTGTCGDNLTWTYYAGNQTLVIEGFGAMYDYTCRMGYCSSPWHDYVRNITSVRLPEGLTYIGDWAFYCLAATNVTIPSSVQSISGTAFMEARITDYFVAPGSTSLDAVKGVLYSKDHTLLISYPSGRRETSYEILPGTTRIGEYAFLYNFDLASVTIPDSVIEIGREAFSDTGITEITIPEGVTVIENDVFHQCTQLTKVNLPGTLKQIKKGAFVGCISLSEINIPNDVESLGWVAFYGCTNLSTIVFPAALTTLDNSVFEGCKNLRTVYFWGDAPEIGTNVFQMEDSNGNMVNIPGLVLYYIEGKAGWTKPTWYGYDTATWQPAFHTHTYSEHVVSPTCTDKGYTTHTCVCGENYVDSYVPALGHAWDDGVVTKQPTETMEGVKTFTCTRCDATRTESIPATGDKPCDGGEGCPSGKFVDVNTKAWYHLYVDYAVKNGLFGGTSENTFEPEAAMTRAMLVTVLWRYEGKPMGYQNTFVDVNAKSGSWYIDAVAWAAANNIVGGIGDGKFDPDGEITREQMATILFRYANWKGIDTSKRGDLNAFPDGSKTAGWAKEAVQWTVAEKIIGGSDGKLLPQGSATRAQVATILMRFIENIVKK